MSDDLDPVCLKHWGIWPVRPLTNPYIGVRKVIQVFDVLEHRKVFRHHQANPKAEQASIDGNRDRSQEFLTFGGSGYIGNINQAGAIGAELSQNPPLAKFFAA
eukprot:TRINITY_DN4959_c0_g3_i1.p2 TRINITY_DN4959_c0_g3~~TRINITY_DN4959_c0_g3_i1.p2  ORF type:complete len:103 (+),score=3.74 TRINITY_DN4959_c0_g3_i1:89-397(+)